MMSISQPQNPVTVRDKLRGDRAIIFVKKSQKSMKLNPITLGAVVVLALLSVGAVRSFQSKSAATAIAEDYRYCSTSYSLLGKEEGLKTLPDSDPTKQLALEQTAKAEASCSRYHKYFKEWADSEIKPSQDLLIALVSRYEPEKLKQK